MKFQTVQNEDNSGIKIYPVGIVLAILSNYVSNFSGRSRRGGSFPNQGLWFSGAIAIIYATG